MKKVHLLSGLVMVFVFVLSGQYLEATLPPEGPLDGNRMMWRASHLYLMMSAVVNVMAGLYYRPFSFAPAMWVQRLGSGLIIASQPVLLTAFAIEPARFSVDRFYTRVGCDFLLYGSFIVLLGWCYQGYRAKKSQA